MKTEITSVEIEVTLKHTSEFQLSVEMSEGYIEGDGGEIYFSENDGVRFADLWSAFQSMFPAESGATTESTTMSGAWIDASDEETNAEIAGTYRVRFTRLFTKDNDDDEFDWCEDQVAVVQKD